MLAIYTRLSREDDTSNSIPNQLREGEQFATSRNLKYKVYNEGEGVSGTLDINDRPQLLSLINDIKEGLISSVWMRSQNRLDRNTATFYVFLDAVKKNHVSVYFGDGDKIDFNDPQTLLQATIMSSLNQYTVQLQSIQTKKSLRDNANEGKAWGVIPYGYQTNVNGYIEINDKEAKTVKEIFDLSLNGWGVKRISTYLTDKGIQTRYNGYEGEMVNVNKFDKSETKKNYKDIVWSAKTVLDILKNTWYIGTRTYAGVEYPTPSIIEKSLFNKVKQNLVMNRNNSGKKVEYRYLLKGLIKCGKCGHNYYGRTRQNKKDNFYMCSSKRMPVVNCGNKSINIPYLETFLIKHLFKSQDLLNHLMELEENDNSLNELSNVLESLNKRLINELKISDRLANLLIYDDLSNDKLFIDKYQKSKAKINDIKQRIVAMELRIKERKKGKSVSAYKKEFENVDLNNFTKLKEGINKIVEKIIIDFKEDSYFIKVKYKGFDDFSIFTTKQPYNTWSYFFKQYSKPEPEDLFLDIIDFKYANGFEMPLEHLNLLVKESYFRFFLDDIIIERNELIEFN